MKQIIPLLFEKEKNMIGKMGKNITFISSFKKSECGIASYTQDLIAALGKSDDSNRLSVLGVETIPHRSTHLSSKIKQVIKTDSVASYIDAAEFVNNSDTDLIHLEHEFGLFSGTDGENILAFTEKLNKPFIITFHTVLTNPSYNQKRIISNLANSSRKIIVMAESARLNLVSIYGIDPKKITRIPHGVPKINIGHGNDKKILGYENKWMISTFGLINSGKGIEYIISALGKIKNEIPNVVFLVIGKTHPKIILSEGERYRKSLVLMVKAMGLENNVIFIDRYLSQKELLSYLKATDIYISAYLEPQQVISGTLAYALGAGKPCISTPYLYAQEVLANGRGVMVPFRNSQKIRDEIVNLIKNPKMLKSFSKKAYEFSRPMLWENVCLAHLGLYREILKT